MKTLGSRSSVAAALTSHSFHGEEVSLSVLGLACRCFGGTLPLPRTEDSFPTCPATSGHQQKQAVFQNAFLNLTMLFGTCQYTSPLPPVKTGHEVLATHPVRGGQHNFDLRSAALRTSFAPHSKDERAAGTWLCRMQGSCPRAGSLTPGTQPGHICARASLCQGISTGSSLQGPLAPALLHRFLPPNLEKLSASSCRQRLPANCTAVLANPTH